MIHFKTLANTKTETILDSFNEAFSDYSIPFQLSLEQLESKISREDIDKTVSVGAFENDELIGFMLHGKREIDNRTIIYNGGTGVIPSKRGSKITQKMYDFIIPILNSQKVSLLKLEVISDNVPAIKSYEKSGFKLIRKLNCYKGEIKDIQSNSKYHFEEIETPNWKQLNSFWNVLPTWQNAIPSISNMENGTITIGAFQNKSLLGYLSMDTSNKRIIQLAINQNNRKNGIASSLLSYFKKNHSKNTSVINVDANYKPINQFFEKMGFKNILQQHEMEMNLDEHKIAL